MWDVKLYVAHRLHIMVYTQNALEFMTFIPLDGVWSALNDNWLGGSMIKSTRM